VVQGAVQNPELQAQKAYHGDLSSLPDKSTTTVHTAEVLWLVNNVRITKGGWLGSDSWFGSVTMAVEAICFICSYFHSLASNHSNHFSSLPLFIR
jgi:hypothetical protein